jgi:hypothetical protein
MSEPAIPMYLLPSLVLFGILLSNFIPFTANALNGIDQSPKISLFGLHLADKIKTYPSGVSEFGIELSMKSHENKSQQYLLILEVRNNTTGISEFLQLQNGTVKETELKTVTVPWTPEIAGRYEIRSFAISDVQSPEILSPLTNKVVIVNLTGGGMTYSYPNEPFSIILIPDTQNYWWTGNEEIAYNQSKWIVANRDKLNIQVVIHLGDIVNTWNNQDQWTKADNMMKILDDNLVPYVMSVGNHDFSHPYSTDLSRDYSYFEKYFPDSRIISNQTLRSEKITSNGANVYTYLPVGGNEFLIVSMEYCPTRDVIDQVSKIIKQNVDKRVILATHAFLRTGGSWASPGGGGVCTMIPGTDDFSTQAIWDLVVYPNPNVFLVVSGHSAGENKRVDDNIAGNPVQQIVIDYQYKSNGGDGMLKIVTFDPEKDKIYFQTYSPWFDSYRSGDRSEFTFNYEMD